MKIVFSFSNGFYAYIIKLVTGGKYTHCGIVIDGYVYESEIFKGVIKTKYNPFDWYENIEIKISKIKTYKIQKFLESELGSGYDYLGALRFVFSFLKPSKNKWFCSELCIETLNKIRFFSKNKKPALYSPSVLYKILSKKLDKL